MTKHIRGGFMSSASAAAIAACIILMGSSTAAFSPPITIAPSPAAHSSTTYKPALRPRSMVAPTYGSALQPRSMMAPTPSANKSVRWAKVDDKDEGFDEAVIIDVEHSSLSDTDTVSETSKLASHRPLETSTIEDEAENAITHALSDMGKGLANMANFVTKHHAALAATFLLFLTVFLNPLPSLAVSSGGSMGGSFGRSSSRQTYSAPARSYSSPSYGQGFSRGFSSGYYSRPSVVVNPAPIMPSPFYSPFWAPTYYSRPVGVVSTGGGFGLFGFVAFVGFALAAMTALSGFADSAGSGIMNRVDEAVGGALGPGVSVAEISVAVDVSNRDDPNSILSVLKRLSNTAKTDSRVGMQTLTSQVALELLRRKNQIVAVSTKSKHFRDSNKASREFNTLAVKERGKFERENRRYGGVDYSQNRQQQDLSQYSPKATMAVITLIVSVEGDSTQLPVIKSQRDVEEALAKIASDVKVDDCLQSAEILWTPEDRTETLTMREVVSDYPELRTI